MIIFVTGATSGFGEAIARKFISHGHQVIAAGRRQERLEALQAELGAQLHIVRLDVRNRAAIQQVIDELPAELRNIDLLVNNAGLALGLEPAHKANVDDWDTMIDTNTKGLVNMTRALLPAMVERNVGHIINIGSTAANWPYAGEMCTARQKRLLNNLVWVYVPTYMALISVLPILSPAWSAVLSFQRFVLKVMEKRSIKPTMVQIP